MKVLIAEDEDINYQYLSLLLEEFQFNNQNVSTILHARNGQEAVELCKEHNDLDFVMMDIRMPVLNGIEAIKQIRLILPDVIIIVQTAFAYDRDQEIALQVGANHVVSKPVLEEDLFPVLKKILARA